MLVLVVLASALLHAGWNALLRRHPVKDAAGVAVVAIAAAVAMGVAAIEAVVRARAPFAGGAAVAWTVAAGLCEAGYFAALVRALAAGPLGSVYTISRGGAVVLVWPLSVALLGEPVHALGVAGSAVLLVGLASSGMARAVPRAAITWAIVTAGFIAGYHLAYKAALAAGAAPAAVFAVALAVALPIFAGASRVGPRRAMVAVRAAPRSTVLAGVVCATSFLVFLVALRAGGAAMVLTLRNTSVVFALGFGAMLGEAPGRRQIAGAVLVAIGAALMGLGG
ncbi:MAG: permease [Kofleriaceae bacterium]|nr:permease [Kofleriaceae bacterium]